MEKLQLLVLKEQTSTLDSSGTLFQIQFAHTVYINLSRIVAMHKSESTDRFSVCEHRK